MFFKGIKIKIDAQAKIFTYKDLRDVPEKKGIYIMFENGQANHSHHIPPRGQHLSSESN